ncbi:MAG: serine hydrolase [Actinomycetaceae bacterium]
MTGAHRVRRGHVLVEARLPPRNANDDPIQSYLDQVMDEQGVPGMAVAIVTTDGDSRAWTLGEDGDDQAIERSTPFLLGSVSKSFTAAAVHDLIGTGDLDLDDVALARSPGEAYEYSDLNYLLLGHTSEHPRLWRTRYLP